MPLRVSCCRCSCLHTRSTHTTMLLECDCLQLWCGLYIQPVGYQLDYVAVAVQLHSALHMDVCMPSNPCSPLSALVHIRLTCPLVWMSFVDIPLLCSMQTYYSTISCSSPHYTDHTTT